MDLTDPATRDAVTERLAAPYAGRPVILGPNVLAGLTPTVGWFRDLGCPVLAVVTARGAGPVPPPEDCRVVEIVPPPASSMTAAVRRLDAMARHLPPGARAAVDDHDPQRRGFWWASPFVADDEPIDGRPVAFGRPAAFTALEDKVLAEGIWDAAGVERAPARTVPVTDVEGLARASEELDEGSGVVWSGDARDGINGGGNYVRWVLDDDDRAAATWFFDGRCDRVRVLPFLEGVPCSVHGYVLPDGTAVLRPVEIVTLRDRARRRFAYAGLGTYWDPPAADRAQMREAARRVGDHLAAAHGYRGAFGVDGVLTADGFRPTELNTRQSAGAVLVGDVDRRFFAFLQAALVEGRDTGLAVPDVESLLPVMDAERTGKVTAIGEGVTVPAATCFLSFDGHAFRRSDAETGNLLSVGDTGGGFFARVEPCAELRPGERLAAVNRALLAYLDEEHGAAFGDLEIAPDVRARTGR